MRLLRSLLLAAIIPTFCTFAYARGGGGGFRGGASPRGGFARGGIARGGFRGGIGSGFNRGGFNRGGFNRGFRGGFNFNRGFRNFRFRSGFFGGLGFGFVGFPYFYGYGSPYYCDPYYYDCYGNSYNIGYYNSGYYNSGAYAAPPAAPVIIQQDFGPPAAPAQTSQSYYRTPDFYLIAFTDHTIRAALTYSVQGDRIHWTSREHQEMDAPLSTVDRQFSQQLNRGRGVRFTLP